MKTFLIIIILISPVVCCGQDILSSTIAWHSQRTMNVETGHIVEEATTLQTYGRDRVEWKNSDGSIRFTFTVRELNGSWTNIAQAGQFTYEVRYDNGFGVITIERNSKETMARIMLTSGDESQFYELTIGSNTVE